MEKNTIVIFCNWDRVDNIKNIFDSLKNQTVNNFDVILWNNNLNDKEYLNNLNINYNYKIMHSKENIGGIGRFYAARSVANNYKKFIFIDDDQTIDKHFIKDMLSYYEIKTIKSRWGWRIKDNNYFTRTRVNDNTKCNYCGTGGMIGDISIFKLDELFLIPPKYQFIEDLWLSFIAYKYKFKTIGIPETLIQLKDGKDQFNTLKPLKNEFLLFLVNKYKWKL